MKIKHSRKYCIKCNKHKFLVDKHHVCIECNHARQLTNTLRNNSKKETQSILTLNGIEIPTRKVNKMNIKESSMAYVPPTTKNITELESISINIDTKMEKFTKEDGSDFEVETFEVNGEKYRLPISVKSGLQAQLKVKPDATNFRVTKTGEGMKTQYFVTLL